MTMTDPIADMLTRLRNANVAMHDTVKMPGSKLKTSLATILEREGYISGFTTSTVPNTPGAVLEIQMKYSTERNRAISGIKRVSTPGLRRYVGVMEIPRVRNGLGMAILSTSQGVMSDRQARQRRTGGELVALVW